MSRTRFSFWLDGGYDRAAVEACRHHPHHKWTTLRMGDVLLHPSDPDERLTICSGCYVPRCGDTKQADRCIWPRHHTEPHLTDARHSEPVGGFPSRNRR